MEQFLHHEEIGKILETQMSDEQFINRTQYLSHETKTRNRSVTSTAQKSYDAK